MFARQIAASKAGLRALNPGDPLNHGLVAWVPFGHIENGGVKAFNLLGSPKLAARDLTGWGGAAQWFGSNSGGVGQGGTFGGRRQSTDDYNTRPSLYLSELPLAKPTRNITLAFRAPNTGQVPQDYPGSLTFSIYPYGAGNLRVEIKTTTTATYNFAFDTAVFGRQYIVLSYDGAKVRVWVNNQYGETASTQSGDLDWNTNAAWYWPGRYVEDFRVWSRGLTMEEGFRWIVQGPTAGRLNAPSRRFAVVGTAAAAANNNQNLPLLGVGD